MGPSSTKNIISGEAAFNRNTMNIFTDGPDENIDAAARSRSRSRTLSKSPEREIVSVAGRSVLSPNFVNGTEESEKS